MAAAPGYDRRLVVDTLVLRAGCAWRMVPHDLAVRDQRSRRLEGPVHHTWHSWAPLQPLHSKVTNYGWRTNCPATRSRRSAGWGRPASRPARNRRPTVVASEASPSTTAAAMAAVQ